jgi:diguanylate cyclase (GGDEF)-like protein
MATSLGNLLIVDDEEMNRDMLSRRLELEGFTVATAGGGEEALRLVEEQNFDAVLLDIMMPVQNGYEVLAEIRKSHTSLELPILMVTAKSHSQDVISAFTEGANDFITKPINFPIALARISCQVANKKLSTQARETDARRPGSAADPLTGLPNRIVFVDHLDAAIQNSRSQPDFLFAVLFLDLDRFKIVNDSLGHQAGDELLIEVARRLESCMRASDVIARLNDPSTIARFGGDEFVVLLKGITKADNAYHVGERILGVLTQPLVIKGNVVSISASIGIAVGSHRSGSSDDLLRNADMAMYQAKTNGKSRLCIFDEAMQRQSVLRQSLESDLKCGLKSGEFAVHYQPIVSMLSGEVQGFEALLRWRHATRGMISPHEFMTIAEESGFIVELGAWVLKQACHQLQAWQRRYPTSTSLSMSVNISPKQFFDSALADRVAECLAETGIAPECLNLEIMESALSRDSKLTTETLSRLHALGARISLDDFGTGCSSLSCLQQLSIDTIKIDRSYIDQLGHSTQAHEIVSTIVALAHSLRMKVTAEGIENRSQLSLLQDMECDAGQGFLYSHPGPPTVIEAIMTQNERFQLDELLYQSEMLAPPPL